jgi:hypothetical protein
MLNDAKTLESFVESPKLFGIHEKSLVGEDAKRLSEEQVLELLNKFSSGDWGSVTEAVRKVNDEQLKSRGLQEGTFLGQYKVEVGDEDIVYYVYGNVVGGKTEMLHITSKNDDNRLHGADIMESIAIMGAAR